MTKHRTTALGLTAGLIGGAAAGLLLGVPALTSASGSSTAVVQQTDDETTEDDTTTDDTTDDQADDDTRPDRATILRDSLQALVDDGTITPEQADAVAAAETAWARAFLAALEPHRAGVYVNFLDADDGTGRVHEAYADDTYARLAEVKARYDPENAFRNNKNIAPRSAAAP